MEQTVNNNQLTQSNTLNKVSDMLDYYNVDDTGKEVILKNVSDRIDLQNRMNLLQEKLENCDLAKNHYNKFKNITDNLSTHFNTFENKLPIKPTLGKIWNSLFILIDKLSPKVKLSVDNSKFTSIDKALLDKIDLKYIDSRVNEFKEYITTCFDVDRIKGLDQYFDLFRELTLEQEVEKFCRSEILHINVEKSGLITEMSAISDTIKDLDTSLTNSYHDIIGYNPKYDILHMNSDQTFFHYKNDSMVSDFMSDFARKIPEEMPFKCKQELIDSYQLIVSSELDHTYRDSFDLTTSKSWKDCIPKLSNETLVQPGLAELINGRGENYDSLLQHEIVKIRGILPDSHMIEFKEALTNNDFVKITALKEEGFIPSQEFVNTLKNKGISQSALIVVQRIYDLNIVSNDLLANVSLGPAVQKNQIINEALKDTFQNL